MVHGDFNDSANDMLQGLKALEHMTWAQGLITLGLPIGYKKVKASWQYMERDEKGREKWKERKSQGKDDRRQWIDEDQDGDPWSSSYRSYTDTC